MRTIYLRKDYDTHVRKILIDMAYLVSHNKIRLPKYYFEEGLYLPHASKNGNEVEKYFLTKDKILTETNDHYFFDFPFKAEEVENSAY